MARQLLAMRRTSVPSSRIQYRSRIHHSSATPAVACSHHAAVHRVVAVTAVAAGLARHAIRCRDARPACKGILRHRKAAVRSRNAVAVHSGCALGIGQTLHAPRRHSGKVADRSHRRRGQAARVGGTGRYAVVVQARHVGTAMGVRQTFFASVVRQHGVVQADGIAMGVAHLHGVRGAVGVGGALNATVVRKIANAVVAVRVAAGAHVGGAASDASAVDGRCAPGSCGSSGGTAGSRHARGTGAAAGTGDGRSSTVRTASATSYPNEAAGYDRCDGPSSFRAQHVNSPECLRVGHLRSGRRLQLVERPRFFTRGWLEERVVRKCRAHLGPVPPSSCPESSGSSEKNG
jgi:hypothetical protein